MRGIETQRESGRMAKVDVVEGAYHRRSVVDDSLSIARCPELRAFTFAPGEPSLQWFAEHELKKEERRKKKEVEMTALNLLVPSEFMH